LIGSPLLNIDGTWRWFITFAQADVYEPRLYKIYLDDYSGQKNLNWYWSERQLTKVEREKILKRHPALTARIFDLKQSCIWDCIINGKHQPLGKIIDTWRRIEFQLRGTPHCHGMACVINYDIITELIDYTDDDQVAKIAKIVDDAVTACLVDRPLNCYNDLEKFANQMHRCCFTCFKYAEKMQWVKKYVGQCFLLSWVGFNRESNFFEEMSKKTFTHACFTKKKLCILE
jgi:hypothetical protein